MRKAHFSQFLRKMDFVTEKSREIFNGNSTIFLSELLTLAHCILKVLNINTISKTIIKTN